MKLDSTERAAYEGYAKSTGGKTFDGRDMPTWHELPQRIRDAWRAAIIAAFEESNARYPHAPARTVAGE